MAFTMLLSTCDLAEKFKQFFYLLFGQSSHPLSGGVVFSFRFTRLPLACDFIIRHLPYKVNSFSKNNCEK